MVLTVSMMVVEIAAGMIFGSMALLADGWHTDLVHLTVEVECCAGEIKPTAA